MAEPVEKIDAEIYAAEAVLGYQEPVAQLLVLGDIRKLQSPYDYLALGLTPADAPELIRLMRDDVLYWSDSEKERWAALHAAHALGQLRAESAVDALVNNLSRVIDDDWVMSDYPVILGQIGPAALPAIQDALRDSTKSEVERVFTAEAVMRVAEQHPDARDRCVALLVDQLRLHAEQPEWLNASLIGSLVELDGREAAPVMAEAFESGHVDLSSMGDWQDVQIELGLLTKRLTPRSRALPDWEPEEYREYAESDGTLQQHPAKTSPAKAKKRKQDKLGRKQARQNKIKKKKK